MAEEMVAEVEEVVEGGEGEQGEGSEPQEGAEGHERPEPEDPYSSKASREYSQWLKSLREGGDPTAAKYARLAKDNHGAMYALKQLDPKGLDGVRERYALLDSVIHQGADGTELRGADAIAALQDSAREIAEIDEKIASGNPEALESFDDTMKAGIVKMAPAILDMARTMDPEGYSAAVLPHFVQALANSELVGSFNGLVDTLNEQPPAWLTAEQKQAWSRDQMGKVVALAGKMGAWLNAQWDKAKGLPKPGDAPRATQTGKKDPIADREKALNDRERDTHWQSKIIPQRDRYMDSRFNELFRPFEKRLNLDKTIREGLKQEFGTRVIANASKNPAYAAQIKRFYGMKNPDPNTVFNFGKVEFDKHAKQVLEGLVNERYKPFLNGKPRVAANGNASSNGAGKGPAPKPGVQVTTVRPAEGTFDPRARSVDDIHRGIFRLHNGKVVQLRK
jgi:hypothetical protein